MSLKERSYSVLVVSSAGKTNAVLSTLLTGPRRHPVRVVSSVSEAKRAWSERSFDHVIINSPLPDDAGVRLAIDTASSHRTVTLLLIRGEDYEDIFDKVVEHGVFTLQKPVSLPILTAALEWMESAGERLCRLEQRTLSVEEKMKEIRLVNRAKWLLISELKMAEPQAHRYIEKQAMDRCVPKRDIAEEIIKTYA